MIVRRTPPAPRPVPRDWVSHPTHARGQILVIQDPYGKNPWAVVTEDWPWLSYVVPLRELTKIDPPKRGMVRRSVTR